MTGPKRAAIYLRTSTSSQHTENQRLELERIAERRGWKIAEVYEDFGISGAKGRDKRPALDRMLKDANRRRFDLVMAWSIDRVGRSLSDLLGTIQHLEAVGVDLFLDQQNIDTTTPAGKLMFQICGAFAEFERAMIKQRIKIGVKRAIAKGVKVGRPKVPATVEREVRRRLGSGGEGIVKIARSMGSSLDLGHGALSRDL